MKVTDLTGAHSYGERRFGMEIEVEYCGEWPQRWWWTRTEDGSLRNGGMEFISPPATLDALRKGITEFYAEGFGKYGWRSTKRTGIHLHMDTSTLTVAQLGAFLTAYAALEPVLFNVLCGPDREENIYCVPWYRARAQPLYVQGFLENPCRDTLMQMCGHMCKYGALYLEPLRRYGTVEFRGAPTFDNPEEATRFVETFDTLIELTRKDGTAAAVMSRFENINDAARYYLPHLTVPEADLMVLRADSLGIADMFVPDPPPPPPEVVDEGGAWEFVQQKKLSASAYKALVGARPGGPVRGRFHIRGFEEALDMVAVRDAAAERVLRPQRGRPEMEAPPRPRRRGV